MSTFKHVSLLELVESYATENNLIDSEGALSEMFDAMVEDMSAETRLKLQDDEPMLSELFNNWTDSLCKDDLLHDEQYNQYFYIGEH